MQMYKTIINKIFSKKLKIGIFGLGYVGLPLALRFAEKKYQVFGYDISKSKIEKLKKGNSYIAQIPNKNIKKYINKNFIALSNFKYIHNLDVLIFCLPTPLKKNMSPDLSFLKKTLSIIKKDIKKGQVFIHESTSYPGTTEEYFEKVFDEKNYVVGKDCFLIFSPEREDPGNKKFRIKNITKIVSGKTNKCLTIASKLYKKVVKNIYEAKSIKTAEMAKLHENIYRSVNIALVNEMKILSEKMGIDIWQVIEAAKTKPFGFQAFYPGPGVGGHCIPLDPYILSWKAKKYNFNSRFINLSGEINNSMPKVVAKKTYESVISTKKNRSKARVLILGVAFKPNVDDYREAPSQKIINILRDKYNFHISYCDPYVPILEVTRLNQKKMKSIKLNYKSFKTYDAVIIITNHKLFDFKKIEKYSKLIIDTRGIYKHKLLKKIIKA